MKKATRSNKQSPKNLLGLFDEFLAPHPNQSTTDMENMEKDVDTKEAALECLQEVARLANEVGESKTKKTISAMIKFMRATLIMWKELGEATERIDILEKKQEGEQARKKIVIKGLNSTNSGEVAKIFKEIDFEQPIKNSNSFVPKIVDGTSKKKASTKITSIVEFQTETDKKEFFRCLARKGRVHEGLHFGDYIPACFAKDRFRLEKEAYDLRKDTSGTRTKVVLGFRGPLLLVKKKGESKYAKKV